MNMDNEPYEIVITTVTGIETALKGKGKECVLIIIPGLQTSDIVKTFRVYDRKGKAEPAQFSVSETVYTKWQK